MFQLSLSKTWNVKQNLFILLVAPRGAGKTPASQVFLAPLLRMEEEEKSAYDADTVKHRKKRKIDSNVSPCAAEADYVQTMVEDNSSERNLFHKKTRVIEQSTPEALILNLHYGSPCLLIKADEFAVSWEGIISYLNLNSFLIN